MIEYIESEENAQLISTFFNASSDDVMRLIEEKVGEFLQQLAAGLVGMLFSANASNTCD